MPARTPIRLVIFLSTLPARGATTLSPSRSGSASNFYPRSPRGERPAHSRLPRRSRYFYPRSPRGERQVPRCLFFILRQISIHAPREGSDKRPVGSGPEKGHFYPRSPRGERLMLPGAPGGWLLFLSTLPARGATPHAPGRAAKRLNFYPRSPRGERRGSPSPPSR